MSQGGAGSETRKRRKKEAKATEAEPAAPDPRIGELEQLLEEARREAADAADRALRTLAEFDNYRKRTERERRDAVSVGAAGVLTDLLRLADDFDRALEHAGADVPESFVEGMKLVARGLHEVLERNGVARIESVGAPFDPEIHEALSSAPSAESAPNTVLQELQAGYRMGERVLRPCRVVVSRAPEE